MAGEVVDYFEAVLVDYLLDGFADLVDGVSWYCHCDSFGEGKFGGFDEFFFDWGNGADSDGAGGVGVHAFIYDATVGGKEVTFLEYFVFAGNSMDDGSIDGGA